MGNKIKFLSLAIFVGLIATFVPFDAIAQANPPTTSTDGNAWQRITSAACKIVSVFNGPIARTIATFGILFMGFSAFLGKLNWGTVLTTALGVFIVFGASEIIETVAKDSYSSKKDPSSGNFVDGGDDCEDEGFDD